MDKLLEISEYLNEESIIDLKSDDKNDAIRELISVIKRNPNITNSDLFEKAIFEREKLMSTGIGCELAIPHARHKSIKDFAIVFGRKKEGLKYESLDDKPVRFVFMIGASDQQDKEYIKLLSRIALRLKNQEIKDALLDAETPADIYRIIKETE